MPYTGFLFDLDGTLLNTAPDLTFSMNILLEKYQRPKIEIAHIIHAIPQGSSAMIQQAFGLPPDHPSICQLKNEFIAIHRSQLSQLTTAYEGIDKIIKQIHQQGGKWGVVTNKTYDLATQVLAHFPFAHTAACIIGADTLAKAKPHPEPLWYAAGILGLVPRECIYIGDALTDIEAGRRAGMTTMLARYGYVPTNVDITTWRADYVIDRPLDIAQLWS